MTTLFSITRDPFAPWKCAERTWLEAKRRGLGVFVALDDRTSDADELRTRMIADTVRPWTSAGHCEDAYRFVAEVDDDWIFLISDDEDPSDLCWRLALEPPFPARFGIPVVPILGRKMWRPDVGIQERLFPKADWRWEGGFEGHSESPHKAVFMGRNPGVIIWHRYPEAPREVREERAARYAKLSPGGHHERQIWENHPEDLIELPDHMAAHLPKRTVLH